MLLPQKFSRLKGWNFKSLTKIIQEAEIHFELRGQEIGLIGGGIVLSGKLTSASSSMDELIESGAVVSKTTTVKNF